MPCVYERRQKNTTRVSVIRTVLPTLLTTVVIFLLPASAHAATYYWVGNDAASTNVASNWKTTDPASCGGGNAVSVPTTTDTIIFDRDCDNGAIIDSALTVTTTTIQNGYSGTITLHTALTTTTYTQSGGTLRLNGQTFTTAGALTINTASTFTAGTGTLALTGGAATINVDSTLSLYNLTINATTATTKTIASSDTLTVTNTLTLTDGLVSQTTIPAAGTIRAQGIITQASTFDGGTARIVIDGTGDQTFQGTATRTAGLLPLLKIDKASGTLTLSGTIRTANTWSYSGGTLAFSNSTVVFGDASLTIAGSHSLQHVIFDQNSTTARTYTIKAGDTLTVLGNLTLDNSTNTSSAGTITINSGFIRVRGDISLPDNAMNHTGTAWMIIDGTGSQLLSGNATSSTGGLINLNINKSSGTLTLSGTIRTAKTWSHSGGTLDPGSSTVSFGGTLTIAGSHTLNHVRFDNYKTAFTVTITSATTLTVNGNLTIDQSANANVITVNTGIIDVKGDLSVPDSLNHTGTATIRMSGTGDQLLSGNATSTAGGLLALDINKASGTLTLSGTIRTAKNWTYRQGSFDATTNNSTVVFASTLTLSGSHTLNHVTLSGSNAAFTVYTGSLLTVQGTIALSNGYLREGTIDTKGGMTHSQDFDGGAGTLIISGSATRTLAIADGGRLPPITLNAVNATISGPSTGTGTIAGTFTHQAGTYTGGAGTLVAESYVYSGGTFNPGTGTLMLNSSADVSFTPPPTLYNLTLNEGLIGRWEFEEGTGLVAYDSSGFRNTGSFSGTPTWSGDTPNTDYNNDYALQLDGSSQWVTAGTMTDMVRHDLTVSVWAKLDPSIGTRGAIVAKGQAQTTAGGYSFEVTFRREADDTEKITCLGTSGTAHQFNVHTTEFNKGEWMHIACTRDSDDWIRLYINGVEKASSQIVDTANFNQAFNLQMGYGLRYPLLGSIDDVRIYHRALSAEEIDALANGEERPTSELTYTLTSSLNVQGKLTLNAVILDASSTSVGYGTLVNNAGNIVYSSSSSSAATTSTSTTTTPRTGGSRRQSELVHLIQSAQDEILARMLAIQEALQRPADGSASLETRFNNSALRRRIARTKKEGLLLVRLQGRYVTFVDVPLSSWFAPYISMIIEKGIAEGYRDAFGNPLGIFGVAEPVTRAEMLKMVLNAGGIQPSEKMPRTLSAQNNWSQPYVAAAEEQGLLLSDDPSYDVHRPATRAEVIHTLLQALHLPLTSSSSSSFTDLPSTHPYAADLLTAASLGILSGDTDAQGNPTGTLRPDDPINRAEVAKIIILVQGVR